MDHLIKEVIEKIQRDTEDMEVTPTTIAEVKHLPTGEYSIEVSIGINIVWYVVSTASGKSLEECMKAMHKDIMESE